MEEETRAGGRSIRNTRSAGGDSFAYLHRAGRRAGGRGSERFQTRGMDSSRRAFVESRLARHVLSSLFVESLGRTEW